MANNVFMGNKVTDLCLPIVFHDEFRVRRQWFDETVVHRGAMGDDQPRGTCQSFQLLQQCIQKFSCPSRVSRIDFRCGLNSAAFSFYHVACTSPMHCSCPRGAIGIAARLTDCRRWFDSPAGPRVRLKTVDPAKGNGCGTNEWRTRSA